VPLSGCQTFNGMVAKITHKNQNQMAYTPPPAVKDEPMRPLTAEQKADVQMAIARSLENQGDTEPAIKAYLEVVKKDSRRADAYHRLAVLHDAKGDSESACSFYKIALKKDPKNAEIPCDFGYSYYLQRNWSEAEPQLRRAIALNSDCARAHTNLGLLLARTGREKEALMEFRKAGCDEAAARGNLGFALTLAEHWPEARRQFELALAADPNSTMAKDGLAAIRWRNGESKSQGATTAAKEPTETPTVQASYETLNTPENVGRKYKAQ
jgi:tetratricopeptide (TPR) repeat protein